MSGLLYDVPALDPVSFVGVALLLVAVATLAVWVPALSAARGDPIRALKAE